MKKPYYHPIFGEISLPKTAPDSAKIRSKRRDEKKRKKAQETALDHVDLEALAAAQIAGKLTGQEMLTFALGSAPEIKKALRDVQIRTGVGASPWFSSPERPAAKFESPKHTIRGKNGPNFASWLVDEVPKRVTPDSDGALEIRRRMESGESAHRIVDMLAYSTDRSWEECRGHVRNLLNDPLAVPDEMLAMVKQARQFWTGVKILRQFHKNAVAARFLEPAEAGDWVFIATGWMPYFLPGMAIPKMHQRIEYIARFVRPMSAKLVTLEFFSVEYRPLFRVQF